MNAIEIPQEQMSYLVYPTERLSGISQEAQLSFAERPYGEHQTENDCEWVCRECETTQIFKNKSEYKYVKSELRLRMAMTDMEQQTQTSP